MSNRRRGRLLPFLIGLIICCSMRAQKGPNDATEIRPNDINWIPNPATAAGGKMALLVGSPIATGLYAFRLKFPSDYKVMPHSHPDERIYTVLEGTWYIGYGDRF